MAPIRPNLFTSPRLAVPTKREEKTSGRIMSVKRRMKRVPIGSIQEILAPQSAPARAPRTTPTRILAEGSNPFPVFILSRLPSSLSP
ncbi:MAG: hypothetical protein BWY86_01432 [Candidatus Aminicenantes bacterium ADurb.Bin508]|nr:MAG: hypothetical protein BWY86_01432 [Candidatus Aminicenantes bacterium ADurb.Bin508]